ncbi:MAG: asparaginase [Acidobacteria bacterium]|nr:asparaginase [Acidobacteriota bacterium]
MPILENCRQADEERIVITHGTDTMAETARVIDKTVADLAARLRRETRWRLPDAFQAALAQMNGLRLVTRNSKDFPPQKWSFVVIPYKLI